ncbi:pleckstrin homology domain-containing family B member 2 isoform X4 [Loxodonta africana]|uniref:pleckstrin homology domain-containing family B member 2 isoform X4 n=1 Tax=Loxodonta africana TaxID=9785 RepID=UPI0030D3F917
MIKCPRCQEMAFVKSGWLLRQSTILRRWKKNWFDLWSDGHLIYYDDQTRQRVEDEIHMPVDCINIRMGHECQDIQPPDGNSKDCMLQIVCQDGKTVNLCAESTDDCLAWKFTLQDSRTNTQAYGYGPYNGVYPPGTHFVYAANGQAYAAPYQYPYAGLYGPQLGNQVIIRERYRADDSDVALGMLAGAATGMALGSLFWVF